MSTVVSWRSPRSRVRHGGRPGGGGVRGAADVAADDADAGPDGRHDAVADARHGRRDGGRAREQRTGHEQDRDVLGRGLAALASDAGHTRS